MKNWGKKKTIKKKTTKNKQSFCLFSLFHFPTFPFFHFSICIGIFFLDDNCEGTQETTQRQVEEYFHSNSLETKWKESDWYLQLKNKVTTQTELSLQKNPMLSVSICDLLASVWFDFDSLQSSPQKHFNTWVEAKEAIQTTTDQVITEILKFKKEVTSSPTPLSDREMFRLFRKLTSHLLPP